MLFAYQVALVSWTESVGVTLVKRDLSSMTLRTPSFEQIHFTILQIFPFTSETKRMGIIVRVSFHKCDYGVSLHCLKWVHFVICLIFVSVFPCMCQLKIGSFVS